MKMSSLKATQSMLLINWVIAPALCIWIWVKGGFLSAVSFVIIWLIADRVWDWLTELLIAGAARIGANEEEALEMEISGEVPERMAFMMLVDLLGTFILPWLVAGFFLGWFWTSNSLPNTSTYPVSEQSTQTYPNPVLDQLTQNKWWLAEYPALIKAINSASGNALSTSYMTGPDGSGKVDIRLTKTKDNSLVLEMKLPTQAIVSIDSGTGDKIPSEETPVIIIRDHNLDGLPDDFHMEPSGEPLYKEHLTKDGFVVYRNHPGHQVILAQWVIGIGYSINYFLHGHSSLTTK